MDDWREHAQGIAPGLISSFVALRWIAGSAWNLILAVVGGAAIAYYCGPFISALSGWPLPAVRVLLGLFGMAVAARVFEAIAAVPIARIVDALLKWRGL